jgi:phosphoribosylformylglycinamidine synthase
MVKALVLSGYGLNCEEETAQAFRSAGAHVDIVHINDLILQPKKWSLYQIMAIPGGFSFGDDTGSGNAFAWRLKNHLWPQIMEFVRQDKLIIGICNGFQILANLGLVPAIQRQYGQRQVALAHNRNARYTVRWVDLKVTNRSPWLTGIKQLSLPVAHGEGQFYADQETLEALKKNNQIALNYVRGEICRLQGLPFNPNGSLDNVAGITDPSGRILGLMPHPERAVFFHHLPHWTLLKEQYQRQNRAIPKDGPGLRIFQNAVNYFHQ